MKAPLISVHRTGVCLTFVASRHQAQYGREHMGGRAGAGSPGQSRKVPGEGFAVWREDLAQPGVGPPWQWGPSGASQVTVAA